MHLADGRRSRPGLAMALVAALSIVSSTVVAQNTPAEVPIAYLTRQVDAPPPLSLVEPIQTDEGVQGARLGIEDNNTTGRFMGQQFVLEEVAVPEDDDVVAAFERLTDAGHRFVVADLPADDLLAIADLPAAADVLIFNTRAQDDALRNAECRANVLHVVPSRAMLADALAQYLLWKQWRNWYLIFGTGDGDRLYADAIRRAATKFGATIIEEREYDAGSTARRTDTGHAQIQKQMPVLTQDGEYDVVVVADESDLFGEYLPYRTWLPRPVVGTQGLVPTSWHHSHEQWAGTQMQNRFEDFAERWMTPRDYTAWLAVRSLGEAATRTNKTDYESLNAYIRGDQFELAGFKGVALTYREWNGQLRQPVLLAAPRALVSVSPQEGFLHQHSELDTLGFDRPESTCRLQ